MKQLDLIQDDALVRQLQKKMAPPLVTLLSAEPEIQFVALRNINLIVQKAPQILSHEVKVRLPCLNALAEVCGTMKVCCAPSGHTMAINFVVQKTPQILSHEDQVRLHCPHALGGGCCTMMVFHAPLGLA